MPLAACHSDSTPRAEHPSHSSTSLPLMYPLLMLTAAPSMLERQLLIEPLPLPQVDVTVHDRPSKGFNGWPFEYAFAFSPLAL
eukprot:gene6-biopygen4